MSRRTSTAAARLRAAATLLADAAQLEPGTPATRARLDAEAAHLRELAESLAHLAAHLAQHRATLARALNARRGEVAA